MTTNKWLSNVAVGTLLLAVTLGAHEAAADQVFADDVIIQGSLCVGFDCTDGLNFGFDTVILKENNTRLFFDDTSTSAGFPANDWRLIANDSVSGGANYFAIEDATAARQLFRVSAGAPANSIFVDSGGRVGFGTATPVLPLQVTRGDTPGMRLEQTASGGYTPQTWDVSGNEANFFVRDVTGGSRLPFRIRPGAPTSSLDIAASGNVGIGTASPGAKIHVSSAAGADAFQTFGPSAAAANADGFNIGYSGASFGVGSAFLNAHSAAGNAAKLHLMTDAVIRMTVNNNGNVGIGTTAPAAQLSTTGTVRFAALPSCSAGIQTNASGDLSCLPSSRQFKTIAGELPPQVALANVMALRPHVGAYHTTPDVPEHWLIAEDVAAIDPALAGFKDGKPFTVKTHNVVADLISVIQQQQRRIEALEKATVR